MLKVKMWFDNEPGGQVQVNAPVGRTGQWLDVQLHPFFRMCAHSSSLNQRRIFIRLYFSYRLFFFMPFLSLRKIQRSSASFCVFNRIIAMKSLIAIFFDVPGYEKIDETKLVKLAKCVRVSYRRCYVNVTSHTTVLEIPTYER